MGARSGERESVQHLYSGLHLEGIPIDEEKYKEEWGPYAHKLAVRDEHDLIAKKKEPLLQNRDALNLVLGYNYYGLNVFYTYDLTISDLGVGTAGSHEIRIWLEYPFRPTRRKPSMKFIPCPKW